MRRVLVDQVISFGLDCADAPAHWQHVQLPVGMRGRRNMRSSTFGICVSAAFIVAAGQAQCEEKIHELRASPTTVHRGFFDATLKPVLTIDSGDIVRL